MFYQVNKEKCLGIDRCGVCLNACPGATQKGEDGKAEVADQEKLQECGGETVCPMGAIEKTGGDEELKESQSRSSAQDQKFSPDESKGRGMGRRGIGRGVGMGRGKGMGKGPQDGRGGGMGRGGRNF